MVILPVLLQQLRDIPEFTVALLLAARGIGTFASQILMIWISTLWTPRMMLLVGFGAHTWAGFQRPDRGDDPGRPYDRDERRRRRTDWCAYRSV
jgi:hypothetical protein